MIAVHNLVLRQGAFVLDGVSLAIPTGRYCVLMGQTGCGKTSILEAIAGLRPLVSGRIVLDEHEVTHWPPGARGIGYVPQDAALFPTLTVRENLAFAMTIRNITPIEIAARVAEMASWLGIEQLLDRTPRGLSGGEAQRVALGRALSFRPRYLLMDEPLSSLDESTRDDLIALLRDLRHHAPTTVLHVTHSQREAELLADIRYRVEGGSVREVR